MAMLRHCVIGSGTAEPSCCGTSGRPGGYRCHATGRSRSTPVHGVPRRRRHRGAGDRYDQSGLARLGPSSSIETVGVAMQPSCRTTRFAGASIPQGPGAAQRDGGWLWQPRFAEASLESRARLTSNHHGHGGRHLVSARIVGIDDVAETPVPLRDFRIGDT